MCLFVVISEALLYVIAQRNIWSYHPQITNLHINFLKFVGTRDIELINLFSGNAKTCHARFCIHFWASRVLFNEVLVQLGGISRFLIEKVGFGRRVRTYQYRCIHAVSEAKKFSNQTAMATILLILSNSFDKHLSLKK